MASNRKFCTRCDRLTDHQTHRHNEASADRSCPYCDGTGRAPDSDGRTACGFCNP